MSENFVLLFSDKRLQIIFTQIDPNDPEATCYFFLKIEGEDRKYNGKIYILCTMK